MSHNTIHATPTYVVSRQMPFYQQKYTVEVAAGGYDYCGADMLVVAYSKLGEMCVYDDPREAVRAATAILEQWRKDEPEEEIGISYGYTHGMFTELPECSVEDAKQWAEEEYKSVAHCDRCDNLIPKSGGWTAQDYLGEDIFCSERCVDFAIQEFFEGLSELELEEFV